MKFVRRLRDFIAGKSDATFVPGPERSPYIEWRPLKDAPEGAWQPNESIDQLARRVLADATKGDRF